MKRLAAGALALALCWWLLAGDDALTWGPGVVAPREPAQVAVVALPVAHGEFELTPVASFEVEARVLSTRRYRFGREADLSPIDFALGWGAMSDEAVLDQLKIWQSGRWFHWRTKRLPIPREEIIRSASNMHMIPVDPVVERLLYRTRVGEVVRLTGKLVNARHDDGWTWNTSLSREDAGDGACEVFLVERIVPIRS